MPHRITFLAALLLTITACAESSKPQPITRYYADPSRRVSTLAQLAPQFLPVRAAADPIHQIVTVEGDPAAVEAAMQLFGALEWHMDDGPGAFRRFFLKYLHNAHAADVAAILNHLNDSHAFDPVPPNPATFPTHFACDAEHNAIFVETEPQTEETIRALIDTLDQPTAETRP